MSVGIRIAELRNNAHMSQFQLAKVLKSELAHWECMKLGKENQVQRY